MDEREEKSIKEQRIRKITQFYYSRPDVQKAIFEFSKNREVVPRYFEGFGKRPDSLQYPGDVFELIKKGSTSLHCSEELWEEPLSIVTGMSEKQLNELRTGWDLLLDIDSKYLDYSKILSEEIIKILRFHGIKNIGIKFSGSKGFHIIVPSKAFPKEINGIQTKDMFPQWPRIISQYITEKTKPMLTEKLTRLTTENKYVKDFKATQEVMPDLILVSPRHLFRMPYSLHEKTALASVVLSFEELKNFQPKDANPMQAKIKNFMPESREGEASELIREALDWYRDKNPEEIREGIKKESDFKTIKISDFSDELLPPSIKKIMEGMSDGRKRALFILINFFRATGMEKEEFEKKIYDWNKKNEIPLKEGYIQSQILWSYRNKTAPPPNYDKDYYKGIGIIPTDEEMRYKNPVNYMVRKSQQRNSNNSKDFSKKKNPEN